MLVSYSSARISWGTLEEFLAVPLKVTTAPQSGRTAQDDRASATRGSSDSATQSRPVDTSTSFRLGDPSL